MTYPNRSLLERVAKTALNAAYIQSDITGDGIKETYCNCFVQTVAVALGCAEFSKPDGTAISANQMIDRVASSPNWVGVDAATAQAKANEGALVVAAYKSDPHGHVAIVIPGKLQASPTHGHELPSGANVGKKNFYGLHIGHAFTHAQCPVYFEWKGTLNV